MRLVLSTRVEVIHQGITLTVAINFLMLGFAFLISSTLSLSLWFFYLLYEVQRYLLGLVGLGGQEAVLGPWSTPVTGHQMMGALTAMVCAGLWMGREHLKDVWHKAIRKTPGVDDFDEIMPYRWTALGGSLGMLILMIAHQRLSWWPFHPLGFAMAPGWTMAPIWFSIFLAWLIKVSILKFGGAGSTRPFFLGLLAGQFATGGYGWSSTVSPAQWGTSSRWSTDCRIPSRPRTLYLQLFAIPILNSRAPGRRAPSPCCSRGRSDGVCPSRSRARRRGGTSRRRTGR